MKAALNDADGWRAELDQLESIALDTHARERRWYLEDGAPSRGTYAYHLRQRELRLASEEADLAYELARLQSGLWKDPDVIKTIQGRVQFLTSLVKRLRQEIAELREQNGDELVASSGPLDPRLRSYLATLPDDEG